MIFINNVLVDASKYQHSAVGIYLFIYSFLEDNVEQMRLHPVSVRSWFTLGRPLPVVTGTAPFKRNQVIRNINDTKADVLQITKYVCITK